MVDDFSTEANILGTFELAMITHPPGQYGIALAIGYDNLMARWKVWQKIKDAGYPMPTLIHPRAYVADSAIVGAGTMIMAGAIVDVGAYVAEATVLWPGACVNHNAHIGTNTFISPSATVCGAAMVGRHTFVGAGAVVVDHVTVPDNTFIKATSCFTGRKA